MVHVVFFPLFDLNRYCILLNLWLVCYAPTVQQSWQYKPKNNTNVLLALDLVQRPSCTVQPFLSDPSPIILRQGPRLTLKKVRRENEVPKKRDFNFDDWYLGQMSPFSPKRGIFGTAHAWIFRISWETQKKFTNIVAGAPRVSSSGLGRFLQSVFLT